MDTLGPMEPPPREDPRKTAQILRAAAEVMIDGGIVRGMRYAPDGSHCALGAIEVAAGTGRMSVRKDTPAVIALSEMLPVMLGPDPYNHRPVGEPTTTVARIATWSNMHCKTAKDVACVMRATAELLEEEDADAKASAPTRHDGQ